MIRILAITGKMGAGKTQVTDLIKAKAQVPITTIKFAGALYEMQNALYKIINKPIPQPKDRKLLQWLGTEWGRAIDKDLWTKLWKERAEFFLNSNHESVVLCDDCRFDNEAELITEMGGNVVEVYADQAIRAKRIPLVETGHASENGISSKLITTRIQNEDGMKELEANVNFVLTSAKIPFKSSK